ncbi:universal stress protein [Croceitalea sp. MTPC9]|uniref:universal stress protein n=1 Tax=unclassified Croceitalea TaxID=2632280 RepID=UPI002B3F2CFC|nr:universal stress protein [Croceitalea sp. MTPC6]GMN17993.1 universal stress protein [Croceitalea sp. MTPC9]
MKKIVLPTDFSENAWNAIFTGLKLYADTECEFYVLHSYEPHMPNMLARKGQQRLGLIYDSLSKYSTGELDRILEYLSKNHGNPNHSFKTLSKSGTLEETLQHMATTKDIDLIVMGTQGASGLKEVFMGSNTVKILKKIKDCPILVVPAGYNFQRLKTLAFPTDFTRTFEKFELLPLIELAKLWKAKVRIVRVADEPGLKDIQQANMKILEERLNMISYTYEDAEFHANVSGSIEKYVQETEIELIAMIRYHHTFWEKIIGEPVVKKIAFHSHVPLLMLPEH